MTGSLRCFCIDSEISKENLKLYNQCGNKTPYISTKLQLQDKKVVLKDISIRKVNYFPRNEHKNRKEGMAGSVSIEH
jgi:hypothetical protein